MAAPIRGTLIGLACAQAVWLMHGGDGNRQSGQVVIQACTLAGLPVITPPVKASMFETTARIYLRHDK